MAIKKLDPKATFKVISQTDDALETETFEELKTGEMNEDGTPVLKSSRHDDYMDNLSLDESKLQFKPGMTPDRFILRALNANELAELNAKYVFVDTVAKKVVYTNRNKMFIEMFTRAIQGVQSADGTVTKLSDPDEIPFAVQVEMGAVVSLIASLDKNEKK